MKKGVGLRREYFDKGIFLTAVVISMMLLYYVNPFENTGIDTWDRTFCSAMGAGVSITKRIRNFYACYVLVPPLLVAFFSCLLAMLLRGRREYRKGLVMIDTVLLCAVTAAYISRYRSGGMIPEENPVVITALVYQLLLLFMSVFDRREILSMERIVFLYVFYLTGVVTMVLLVPGMGIRKSALALGTVFAILLAVLMGISRSAGCACAMAWKIISCWMWLPFVACILLEGLFWLNEKGAQVSRFQTAIRCVCLAYAVISACAACLLRRGKGTLDTFGYIGALSGFCSTVYLPYTYFQHAHLFVDNDHIYEIGNLAFAADSVRNGKLPVIDYFSAHALSDTLPSIAYALIHGDTNGALSNPYGRLPEFLGLIVVFLIVKKLFQKEYAVLFACLFPLSLGLMGTVKTMGVCMVVVLVMLYALEWKNGRGYLLFWLTALMGAFFRYDDGINLGVGCIAALLYVLAVQRDWGGVRRFACCGGCVGTAALLAYFVYCKISGIHAVSRILEWLSLTLGSNSTWAMYDFGDAGTLAFFVCYIAVPLCTVSVLAIVTIHFAHAKAHSMAAAAAVAFSVCGILYVPRTIVFHNLADGSGATGVLLNIIHWTIASFALYVSAVRNRPERTRFAAWIAAFGITLAAEGALVTGFVPDRDASLYNLSADYAWERKTAVSDDMSSIWGKNRIVCPDVTQAFCTPFETVFDLLLEEEETFLDFANITALYAFVGRERPFYVTQSPSLLTDLRSQQYFLEEVGSHEAPLAVIGNTEGNTVSMMGIYHNVRYYTVAEYIYRNYRPLVHVGAFVVWCELDRYDEFAKKLGESGLLDNGYALAGYMDNPPTVSEDENGEKQYECQLYHRPDIGLAAYIWANHDRYHAAENAVLETAQEDAGNAFFFSGSQFLDSAKGNYIAFSCESLREDVSAFTVTLGDSSTENVRYQCSFSAMPGEHTYLIRASQDYLWFAYNIDTIQFPDDGEHVVRDVRILQGD